MEAITDREIENLEAEALQAGDAVMVGMCRVALFGGPEWTGPGGTLDLTPAQRRRLDRMRPTTARAACVRAIEDAQAQR